MKGKLEEFSSPRDVIRRGYIVRNLPKVIDRFLSLSDEIFMENGIIVSLRKRDEDHTLLLYIKKFR